MNDLETVDDWERHFERQHKIIKELLLDDSEDLVDLEEFHRRLYVKYGVTLSEGKDGSVHYKDPTTEWRSERAKNDESVESVMSREKLPIFKCVRMIKTDQHPEDLPEPKEQAKNQVRFNRTVDREFERQIEDQEDPFPLNFPPEN